MFIDTHAHIQFDAYKTDRDAVIERCRDAGIVLNVVGTQTTTSRRAVEMAENHELMYASIGTHPIHLHRTHVDEEETSFQSREEGFDLELYSELVQSPKVIGVGECGLDLYHLPSGISKDAVLQKQQEVFLQHVKFAEEHDLPLVIHCRDAHDEMIALLRSLNREIRGTVHCYTSTLAHAKAYLELGLYLGFTGVITFPPKKLDPTPQLELVEVVKKMPIERILVETDSPYLAAQAYRGKRAEPWMVKDVVQMISEIRGLPFEGVRDQILENTLRLFSRIKI